MQSLEGPRRGRLPANPDPPLRRRGDRRKGRCPNRQVVDVLELNVGYGQGNLFGEPRAIRDAVLAETDPPADFMRTSLRRRAAR